MPRGNPRLAMKERRDIDEVRRLLVCDATPDPSTIGFRPGPPLRRSSAQARARTDTPRASLTDVALGTAAR
jgi:hypothetical protein